MQTQLGITVNLFNLAVGGTTTMSTLSQLPMLLQSLKTPPDIIMIDFSVNDGMLEYVWHSQVSTSQDQLLNSPLLAAFEQMIMYLRSETNALLWIVQGNCRGEAAHARVAHSMVAKFYGLPYSSYVDMISQIYGSDATLMWGNTNHPHWNVHMIMARMLAYAWEAVAQDKQYLTSEMERDAFIICNKPTFQWKARAGATETPYRIVQGAWQEIEDRNLKPGLISVHNNSVVEFPGVKFGEKPRLVVSFLRGYRDLGDLKMTLPTHNGGKHAVMLHSMDNSPIRRVTQSYSANMDVWRSEWHPEPGLTGNFGMGVAPGSEHVLRFETTNDMCSTCKVKLIHILAC